MYGKLHASFKIASATFAWFLFACHVLVILGRRVGCKSDNDNSHLQLQEVGLGLHSSVRVGDWMWVCSYAE